jgi:hypothetical protein
MDSDPGALICVPARPYSRQAPRRALRLTASRFDAVKQDEDHRGSESNLLHVANISVDSPSLF